MQKGKEKIMDTKVFEHEGYARIDAQSGFIEIIGEHGEPTDLASSMIGELSAPTVRRIKIRVYLMDKEEAQTARQIFSMPRR